jgi:hypothetical protein
MGHSRTGYENGPCAYKEDPSHPTQIYSRRPETYIPPRKYTSELLYCLELCRVKTGCTKGDDVQRRFGQRMFEFLLNNYCSVGRIQLGGITVLSIRVTMVVVTKHFAEDYH